MEQVELSVVLPAYREARALEMLLPLLVPAVQALATKSEIIVADSLEPLDDTASVCAQFGVRHLHRIGGNTYGDAVRTGIHASRGKRVLLMDADGSHNPEDIRKLWEQRARFDVVIGSRYVSGGKTKNPVVLIWMSRIVNVVYKLAFSLSVRDVSNSFRLYSGAQLRSLELTSHDFEIVEEILIRLKFGPAKSTIVEVPVTFEQRKAGESKRNLVAFMFSYLGSILRLTKFRNLELAKAKRAV